MAGRGIPAFRLFALAICLGPIAIALAACGSSEAAATPSPPVRATDAPSSPVVGIVVALDSHGLADVRGFTLRTPTGRVIQFRIGTLDNGAVFPPGHLGEHLVTAEPLRVFFKPGPDGPIVYHLEDASPSPSPSQAPSPS